MKRFAAAVFSIGILSHPAFAGVNDGLAALDKGDYANAAEQFAKSLDAGQADGAFYLGRMLELGIGRQADLKAAVDLYARGAKGNSVLAKNRLGVLHLEGTGVLQDYQEGGRLVCEAADAGDANGQFNCGMVKLEGRGAVADIAAGLAYLKKAAAADHIGAQNILAQAYLTGQGVPKDEKAGVALLQKTAAAGNPAGLFSLGQVYAIGLGVDKDPVKAHSYFNLAAVRQHPEAVQARQTIERDMTPDQVKAAQQMARDWKASGSDQASSRLAEPDADKGGARSKEAAAQATPAKKK